MGRMKQGPKTYVNTNDESRSKAKISATVEWDVNAQRADFWLSGEAFYSPVGSPFWSWDDGEGNDRPYLSYRTWLQRHDGGESWTTVDLIGGDPVSRPGVTDRFKEGAFGRYLGYNNVLERDRYYRLGYVGSKSRGYWCRAENTDYCSLYSTVNYDIVTYLEDYMTFYVD